MVWSQRTPLTNCEYYKPSTGIEHNTTEIVQARDISVSTSTFGNILQHGM